MGKKIIAVMAVLLLLFTSMSYASYGPQEADAAGTMADPKMVSSSVDDCRILVAGSSMTAYMGINWNAFHSPSVTIRSWTSDAVDSTAIPSDAITLMTANVPASVSPSYSNGVTASVSKVQDGSDFNGLYGVTLTAGSAAADDKFYKFEFRVTETVANVPYTQQYYYCVYMEVLGSDYTVMVKDVDDVYKSTIRLERDTPYQASVKIGSSYDHSSYRFYATGLPDGMNMRLDGIIEGKPAGHLFGTVSEGDAVVYAVSKTDPTEVHSGNLHYLLTPISSFEYAIDVAGSTRISCFDDGYMAMPNLKSLSIRIMEVTGVTFDKNNYAASLTLGSYGSNPVQISDTGTLTINSDFALSDYTGVVQLEIIKTVVTPEHTFVYSTTVHILAVGPLVHSGLSPSMTSS